MDNRIFNVNGSGQEMLLKALSLAFEQEGSHTTCTAWSVSKKHGLILQWSAGSDDKSNKLPNKMTAEDCLPLVMSWLEGDEAKGVACEGWDEDSDHDGSNSNGWRVYCEDWGHVDGNQRAICAIKPAYLWHGK